MPQIIDSQKEARKDCFIADYIRARDAKYKKYQCQGQHCERFDGECEICEDSRSK